MEPQIRGDKILEFKALTMNRGVFKQLRTVKSTEDVHLIGWVQDEISEMFVGKLGNTLVRITRMDMWDKFSAEREQIIAEAQRMGVGPTQLINIKLDELRDSLPQIFVK